MKINQAGLDLIKEFEGCELEAYQDSVGVWTIGFGHTGEDVYEGQQIDQDTALSLLQDDLKRFCDGVSRAVTVGLTDNQFAALVSFSYNEGLGNLQHSTLLKLVNNENFTQAAEQFERWDKAGGVEMPGLLRRRLAEKALFLS